jgi:hypothetical protein
MVGDRCSKCVSIGDETKLVTETLDSLVIDQSVACKSAGELYESRVDKRRILTLSQMTFVVGVTIKYVVIYQ